MLQAENSQRSRARTVPCVLIQKAVAVPQVVKYRMNLRHGEALPRQHGKAEGDTNAEAKGLPGSLMSREPTGMFLLRAMMR